MLYGSLCLGKSGRWGGCVCVPGLTNGCFHHLLVSEHPSGAKRPWKMASVALELLLQLLELPGVPGLGAVPSCALW